MGKKKPGGKKAVAGRRGKSAARKGTRRTDHFLAMTREEQSAYFDAIEPEELGKVLEESYNANLVHIFLDLKKATVKRLFDLLAAVRKRSLVEAATLYYYEEYLTNPLPLRVEIEPGRTMPNYYALLGVPRDASDEELKAAHRLLERAHGPASFSPDLRRAGEDRLKDIQDAFNNLKNPARRAKADRLLPNMSYLYPRRDQSWFEAVTRIIA
jgi:DnaJ-like protein